MIIFQNHAALLGLETYTQFNYEIRQNQTLIDVGLKSSSFRKIVFKTYVVILTTHLFYVRITEFDSHLGIVSFLKVAPAFFLITFKLF